MTIDPNSVKIEASWKEVLLDEFAKPYFAEIKGFLTSEKKQGKAIYPPGSLIFNAFNTTPFKDVNAVILGQDPYHGPNQAHGLSFSVPMGVGIPPSLRNVYKELESDIPGFVKPSHGNLESWANQGVFLLNAMLTVEARKSGSHRKIGWQLFTDAVIRKLSDHKEGVVFMLWGNFAKNKRDLIDSSKHHILEAAHPSPLAGSAFLGNKHFSTTNRILEEQGKSPIDWRL
ncbi:MAG: uracil-DNA glycosylase [Bacteroidota bacterium]